MVTHDGWGSPIVRGDMGREPVGGGVFVGEIISASAANMSGLLVRAIGGLVGNPDGETDGARTAGDRLPVVTGDRCGGGELLRGSCGGEFLTTVANDPLVKVGLGGRTGEAGVVGGEFCAAGTDAVGGLDGGDEVVASASAYVIWRGDPESDRSTRGGDDVRGATSCEVVTLNVKA